MLKSKRTTPSTERAARLEHAERIGRPLAADAGFENHPKVKAFYAEPETQQAMELLRERGKVVTERTRLGRTKEVERELAVVHMHSGPVGNSLFLSEKGLLMRNTMDMGLPENERFYRVPDRESAERIDFEAVRAAVRRFLADAAKGTAHVAHVPDDFNPEG